MRGRWNKPHSFVEQEPDARRQRPGAGETNPDENRSPDVLTDLETIDKSTNCEADECQEDQDGQDQTDSLDFGHPVRPHSLERTSTARTGIPGIEILFATFWTDDMRYEAILFNSN